MNRLLLFLPIGLLGCSPDGDLPSTCESQVYFADDDGDGFGDESRSVEACEAPSGYVLAVGDCDDTSPYFHPGAREDDCADPNDYNCDGSVMFTDADGDGSAACEDCDDADAERHPGATEWCDEVDQDCDGRIDDNAADAGTFYADGDGDGFGDSEVMVQACEMPAGYAAEAGDCDDVFAGTHPEAEEICDEGDNDCDGGIDEGATDVATWYWDGDGDGHGDPAGQTVQSCAAPEGYAQPADDCDDADATVSPRADEVCDGLDNDCDGAIDQDAVDETRWYVDRDGDAFGDETCYLDSCELPEEGYVGEAGDCDDYAAGTGPEAPETCDGADNDCDGLVDEEATDQQVFYADLDGDGFGDPASAVSACEAPSGFVTQAGDCDDADAELVQHTFYADSDGDGFGDGEVTVQACEAPSGFVADDTDCDDAEEQSFPGAVEICDGVDNDCDGEADSAAVDAPSWYADVDGDGFGDGASVLVQCEAPEGYVDDATDCDDQDIATQPGAAESCDGVDNDCNGQVDDDAIDGGYFYADGDGDGVGAGEALRSCALPGPDYSMSDADCDDGDASTYPGATETCGDSVDSDCDGSTSDIDAEGGTTWYADNDGDGLGDPDNTTETCSSTPPSGYTDDSSDCADDGTGHPDDDEVCDGVDNDCDGIVDEDPTDGDLFYRDSDQDGYGQDSRTKEACEQPDGWVSQGGDCSDSKDDVYPGRSEQCDGVDNDCDGDTDEGRRTTYYADSDGDGYGNPNRSSDRCERDDGWTSDTLDCDDSDALINPDGIESCDGDDNDCDGITDEDAPDGDTWYADADDDGFGNPNRSMVSCEQPEGYGRNNTDCDDSSAVSYPEAREVCDEGDNDCDGLTDEGVTESFFVDADLDGFGDPNSAVEACEAPSGLVEDGTDCDDESELIYPGATELLDWSDSDCDGIGDNLTTDDAYARIYGESKNLRLGESVVPLGDVDGDGADDLLVGGRGMAYVVLGGQAGDVAASSGPADYAEVQPLSRGGTVLAQLGDLDGDGVVDVAIGAPRYTGSLGTNTGQVYLYSGSSLAGGSQSMGDAVAIFTGEDRQHGLGTSIVGADTDGDGKAELFMGAPKYDLHGVGTGGAVYVMSGTLEGDYDMTAYDGLLLSEDVKDYAGEAVDAGDMDGDGRDDLIIGARGQDSGASGGGAAYLVAGPVGGTVSLANADAILLGEASLAAAGTDVDLGADLDGDGYNDAIVGAPGATERGQVYVVYGPMPSGTLGLDSADVVLTGHELESGFGREVEALGDVDGDGLGDLAFGVHLADDMDAEITNVGGSWIVLGPHVGAMSTGDADASLLGLTRSTSLGYRVSTIGDWNSDGYADLAVAGPKGDPLAVSNAGEIFIFLGYP